MLNIINIFFLPFQTFNWYTSGIFEEAFMDGVVYRLYMTVFKLFIGINPGVVPTENWLSGVVLIVLLIEIVGLGFLTMRVIWSKTSVYKKIVKMLGLFAGLYIALFLAFWGILIAGEIYNPVSSRYADINAALKNTCSGKDTVHCPKNKQELLGLDRSFGQILAGKKYWYEVDPATLRYTLVVQDEDWRGVIFDPRLSNSKNENGVALWDFKDIEMRGCTVLNPPEFDGLWNNLCKIPQ